LDNLNHQIFFTRSTDGGANFSALQNLSHDKRRSTIPQIAAVGSDVYVVWYDDTPGKNDIFFTRSTDGGASFSEPQNLSNNQANAISPLIAAEGRNVYVVWEDTSPGNFDIFFTRSTDMGASFSVPQNLSNNRGTSGISQIAVAGSDVYGVWMDGTAGNGDIFFAHSTDGGASFSVLQNLSDNAGVSSSPHIAVAGSNVYVVWMDDTPGNADIFFASSTDGGASFSAPQNLSNNAGNSIYPQIAVAGSNAYVTYLD